MKKISEMTEQEIRLLTETEIELMIKYAMAEAGVKFVNKPLAPKLIDIPGPGKIVYQCDLFGNNLSFEKIEELRVVTDLLNKLVSRCVVDYEWNAGSNGSSYSYFIKKSDTNSNELNISSRKVYSSEVYESLKETILMNKKEQEAYEKLNKEYLFSIKESKSIRDEILSKYNEIIDKYAKLDQMCWRMRNDYMPLSEGSETIAINFLTKAYSLTHEEIQYVLDNYTDRQLEIPGV